MECHHPDEVWLRDSLEVASPIRRVNLCRWMTNCKQEAAGAAGEVKKNWRGAANPLQMMLDKEHAGGWADPRDCRPMVSDRNAGDSDEEGEEASDDEGEPTDKNTRYFTSVLKRANLARVARALPDQRLPASRTLDAYGDPLEVDVELGYSTWRQLFPAPTAEEMATLKPADRAAMQDEQQ